MSIVSDIFDGGGFNWGSLAEPVVSLGANLLQNGIKSNSRNSYYDALKAEADQQYQDTLNYNNAYSAYLGQAQAARAANSAAARQAAAARLAAARQTEANRQAAAKKGFKEQQKYYQEAKGYLTPYADAGAKALPMKLDSYTRGNDLSKLLQAYLSRTDQMAKLDAGNTPAWNINVPVPTMKKA